MAAFAHQCLVAALDHSKAEHIEINLDLNEEGVAGHASPVLKLSPRALRFFADVLGQRVKREPMLLLPQKHELTTQEAANFLNVSRPFVIKEIEARLPEFAPRQPVARLSGFLHSVVLRVAEVVLPALRNHLEPH